MNRHHAHKPGQVMISWLLGYFLTWGTEGGRVLATKFLLQR